MANQHEQQDLTMAAMAPGGNAMSIAARSPEFLCNAVALTASGAMFLGLPRWTGMKDTPSVAQVDADGALRPFPGGAWNDWAFGKPVENAFVQVNALHVFGDDTLWVVDQGAPDRKATLPGAQKVLQFDTRSGALLRALRFGADILPEGACLNDLRIWGSRIYLTDSGRGAIVVHDIATGRTLRRLDAHPLLLQSEVHPLRGSGRRVLVDADGERPRVGSDFLEISPDGQWLYFSTPTGPFRRVPTALLSDPLVDDDTIAASIIDVATIPTLNGSAMDSCGNLYLANAEQRCIEVLAPSGQRAVLASDERLVDPDALFITRDRRLFVPATQSERLPEHDAGHNGIERPFLVLSMALPASVDGIALGHAIAPLLSTGPAPEADRGLPRGVEHVGITVPDHDAALRFFADAFGAEPLFSLTSKGQDPIAAADIGSKNGLAAGTAIVAVSMLRVQDGPNLEVFEIDRPHGAPGQGISDLGISHFSVTVDDIDAAIERFAAAGGTLLEGPYELTGQEAGPGNRGCFGRTPWGLLVEFESFGAPVRVDSGSRLRRWLPRRGA